MSALKTISAKDIKNQKLLFVLVDKKAHLRKKNEYIYTVKCIGIYYPGM